MTDQARGPALPGGQCRVPPHEGWSELETVVGQIGRRPTCLDLRSALAIIAALVACIIWAIHGHAAPALPGGPCEIDPRETWSETEQWVWSRVCIAEIADLNQRFDPGGPPLDPRSAGGWTDERKLGPAFLETILLHDPWRSAIAHQGVRIFGAWFDETVDLIEAEIAHQLWLNNSRFTSDVDSHGIRTKSLMSLDGSVITGTLDMESASIGGYLLMGRDAEFAEVILRGAKIGGQLALVRARVTGTLNMDSASVGGPLLMSYGAEFADVWLVGANIGGQLGLVGATITRTLVMDGVSVGGSLHMREGEFAEVELRGAKIGGQLSLIGAKVTGKLNMDSISIDGSLLMQEGAEFAEVILPNAKISRVLSLVGAKVTRTLYMEAASIGTDLFMHEGTEAAEFSQVNLRRAKIAGQLSLSGAKVTGTLNMASASIGGDLWMHEGAEFTEVNLNRSQIGGQLNMIRAKVTGTLSMDAASVGSHLLAHEGAEFAQVILRGAKIGGQLALARSRVSGTLNMDSASIAGSLFMFGDSEFADVWLVGAKTEGELNLSDAEVTGRLNMRLVSIGDHLYMRDGRFSNSIDLDFARIGGNLDLRGAMLPDLDLTGARIERELRLASGGRSPQWSDDARLVLRNTWVGAVQDDSGAWPKDLDLNGFTYGRFSGFGAEPEAAVEMRGSRWFAEWLARDEPYKPQPYQQAARVLREMGHPEMADDVLYAGRERERSEAWQRDETLRWFGLSMLNWTIGYGHGQRFFRALYWVAGLVLIGTVVLGVTGQNQRDDGRIIGIWYSLDMLLPIIQLRKAHYDIDLEGFARYWFYFHKLMGYVLASFLIAGLAGLTK